jgi:hypothetical protein
MTNFPIAAITRNVVTAIEDAVIAAGENYKMYVGLSPEYTTLIACDPVSILVGVPLATLQPSTCSSGGISCAQVQEWKIAIYILLHWSEDDLESYLENFDNLDYIINLVNGAVKNLETPVTGSVKLPALEPLAIGHYGETDQNNIIMIGYGADRYN